MLIHKHAAGRLPGRLVILGAGGFVGSALLNAAHHSAVEVVALHAKTLDLTKAGCASDLAKIIKPGDSLVFAAAIDKGSQSGSDVSFKNLSMVRHLIEAVRAAKPQHLIYVSSDAVYPQKASQISEETAAAPHDLYGSMHRMRELMLEAEAPVPLAVLRLAAVYGKGDTHSAYGPNRFIRDAVEKKTITLFGDGEEMRDHIYIDDVAQLIIETIRSQSTGLLNLASGNAISFHDLAQKIADQTGAVIEHALRRVPIAHKHHNVTARLKAFPRFIPTPLKAGITQMLRDISA